MFGWQTACRTQELNHNAQMEKEFTILNSITIHLVAFVSEKKARHWKMRA